MNKFILHLCIWNKNTQLRIGINILKLKDTRICYATVLGEKMGTHLMLQNHIF